jgi:serine/threonine-protein kinase RsbW
MAEPITQILQVKTDLAEVERANDVLHDFWTRHQLPEDLEFPVALSLEEVLSNVIRHGSSPGEDAQIQIRYSFLADHPGWVEIEVSDQARPFDPLSVPPPDITAPLEERSIGGLGVFLVRKMMDEVRYQHSNGRNHLLFRKNLE